MIEAINEVFARFRKIKDVMNDPRLENEHPDYEPAQDAMLAVLKTLSFDDIVSNISEMTDEELNYIAWNVEYLVKYNPDLIGFFEDIAKQRNNGFIEDEIRLYLKGQETEQ